jgi:hypothetical protein
MSWDDYDAGRSGGSQLSGPGYYDWFRGVQDRNQGLSP